MWVLDSENKQVVNRQITYTPGLYKIFDEIMVNASDNKQRDSSMNKIEVNIDREEGSIRVWNNGTGIPIVMHAEHNIYVPELIFANLLTGSNFDDEEEKTTGRLYFTLLYFIVLYSNLLQTLSALELTPTPTPHSPCPNYRWP